MANSRLARLSLAAIFIGITGCVHLDSRTYTEPDAPAASNVSNPLLPAGTHIDRSRIQSLRWFVHVPEGAPLIRLHSSDQLTVVFDDLNTETTPFRVDVTHHNRDWSPSVKLPGEYMRGFHTDYITRNAVSAAQNPGYIQYTYHFPNTDMGVEISGNFMMHVYDDNTNQRIFSIPFFVSEEQGVLNLEAETLFNRGYARTVQHQLFGNYYYPDFLLHALMDVQLYFYKHDFWGRAEPATETDVSENGLLRAYQKREAAFTGTFEYLFLNMPKIDTYSDRIAFYDIHTNPPRVTLVRDVIDLNPESGIRRYSGNAPIRTRSARYALTTFQLDTNAVALDGEIHIIGTFSNWLTSENSRMILNSDTGWYETTFFLKEGSYVYSYVVVKENYMNEFGSVGIQAASEQRYHGFVYFADPAGRYDRLLKTSSIFTE